MFKWWQKCILATIDAGGAFLFTRLWLDSGGWWFMWGGMVLTVGICIALGVFFYVRTNGSEGEDAEDGEAGDASEAHGADVPVKIAEPGQAILPEQENEDAQKGVAQEKEGA